MERNFRLMFSCYYCLYTLPNFSHIFPLIWFTLKELFSTKYFVLSYSIDVYCFIYIHIHIVVYIIWNKLYLVGCIHGLNRRWFIKRQWFHRSIQASPAYIWCMSSNIATETHFIPVNIIHAQYVSLDTDTAIHVWGIYSCLGNEKCQKILFCN